VQPYLICSVTDLLDLYPSQVVSRQFPASCSKPMRLTPDPLGRFDYASELRRLLLGADVVALRCAGKSALRADGEA
jgi:hypothetical protein